MLVGFSGPIIIKLGQREGGREGGKEKERKRERKRERGGGRGERERRRKDRHSDRQLYLTQDFYLQDLNVCLELSKRVHPEVCGWQDVEIQSLTN